MKLCIVYLFGLVCAAASVAVRKEPFHSQRTPSGQYVMRSYDNPAAYYLVWAGLYFLSLRGLNSSALTLSEAADNSRTPRVEKNY